MGEYLLGLDAGNTVIKAVIFDLQGKEIAAAAEEGHSRMPRPGHVERGLDELWQNARLVIASCLKQAGISPADIAAIGCAGHGNGLYALDKAGDPLLGIQSIDTRASALVEEWQAAGVGDRTYPIGQQRPWPAQTPTLMAWLKRHQPEMFAKIGTVFLCKDFIVNRLTGERVSEVSDMIGCGLLHVAERRYDRPLMQAYGLEEAFDTLPRLLESAEIAGHVSDKAAAETGLKAGTPVVAGLFDVIASALGSGVARTGAASIIAGTWSINQVVIDRPALDGPVFMSSSFDHERYMAIESSATSAANLEWIVREFFADERPDGRSPFEVCSELVGSVAPADDNPHYHPYVYGAQQDGNARAGFYGVGGWHTKAHLLHAVFEGVAFGHRWHIDNLRRAGARFDEAILSGGGSRSAVWPQIFADVLGVPVSVARSRETGALGAAIAAGIGVGLFGGFEAGAAAMTEVVRSYQPNPQLKALYDRRYALHRDIVEAMTPIWKRLASAAPA
ncbi:carbohydrate kinase [Rhizobium sp. LjRoot30]|uniref:FGGY-family carbohydrate kinase n=1 Tax=Rhizobium sp. LjRoot30 TaxID=3342320 RepID=UPI003ED08E31